MRESACRLQWVDVTPETEYAWTKIANQLKDTEEIELEYNLSFFGKLSAGKYRLCKNDDIYAEFELIEN